MSAAVGCGCVAGACGAAMAFADVCVCVSCSCDLAGARRPGGVLAVLSLALPSRCSMLDRLWVPSVVSYCASPDAPATTNIEQCRPG
jgi:hypothetical protein